MPSSLDIVVVILLLLPGLIALWVHWAFTPSRAPDVLGKTAVAVIVSMLSYLAVWVVHAVVAGWLPWFPNPEVLVEAPERKLRAVLSLPTLGAVFAASIVGATLGVAAVKSHQREWLYRCAHRARISFRRGYGSHWDCVMHTVGCKQWVQVNMKDGKAYQGWLENFSDGSDERSLLLSGVRQYDADDDHFMWRPDEWLFIPSLTSVESMRITPVKEAISEQPKAHSAEPSSSAGDHSTPNRGDQGDEQQSESAARGAAAHQPEQASEVVHHNGSVPV